jgi:hypothetical protein
LNEGQLKNYKFNFRISQWNNTAYRNPGAKEAKVQDYIIDFMESCSSKKRIIF